MSRLSQISELIKKIYRFGPLISIGNVILTYGTRILSPQILQQISDVRNKSIQRYLTPLVERALSNYTTPSSPSKDSENVIWVCWLQGENNMPPIPAMCLDSIRKNAGEHKVQVITLKNFSDFVTIDSNIIQLYHTGKLKNCHFADILRVSLLAQRGGVWMDATLYCTSTIDDRFFTGNFHTIRLKPFGNFVSQCRWAVFCLSARPGNKLFAILERLFIEYLTKEHLFIDYFLFDQFIDILYQKDSDIRNMIDNVPKSNPHIFGLSKILTENFDSAQWDALVSDTSIFKLNWKLYSTQNLECIDNTYYQYLKLISK